jgi:PIN domain nuclease of toxin-antitoxin system
LWWYLQAPENLSASAVSIFQLAEAGNATLVVPAIAVAELYYVSVKERQPVIVSELMEDLASRRWIEFSDLSRAQLEYLDRLPEIPEMHDRLIAAESILLGVPLLTRDRELVGSPQIETIW